MKTLLITFLLISSTHLFSKTLTDALVCLDNDKEALVLSTPANLAMLLGELRFRDTIGVQNDFTVESLVLRRNARGLRTDENNSSEVYTNAIVDYKKAADLLTVTVQSKGQVLGMTTTTNIYLEGNPKSSDVYTVRLEEEVFGDILAVEKQVVCKFL